MQRCQCARLTGWTTRPLKSAVLHDDTDLLAPCAAFTALWICLHNPVCQHVPECHPHDCQAAYWLFTASRDSPQSAHPPCNNCC